MARNNNKVYYQMKQMKKAGLTNVDLARIRETSRKEAKIMENRCREEAFLCMLAIPLNVLVNDYWSKSAKKRAPKFIDDVISLWESYQDGVVTDRELADLLKEYSGATVSELWLEAKNKE